MSLTLFFSFSFSLPLSPASNNDMNADANNSSDFCRHFALQMCSIWEQSQHEKRVSQGTGKPCATDASPLGRAKEAFDSLYNTAISNMERLLRVCLWKRVSSQDVFLTLFL